MIPPRKPSFNTTFSLIVAAISTTIIVAGVLWGMRHRGQPVKQPFVAQVKPAGPETNFPSRTRLTNSMPATAPKPSAGVLPNYSDFKERPLSVVYESPHFQWTVADGKDTNVIRELAHNQLEYDRMVEENSRIFKRQLVYLKDTAASVFEQAKLTGQPVTQITLPGVDGRELSFQIVRSDGNGSSRQGQFSGHLGGNNDSLVTLAFEDGRQAFTILSPKENIFIVGEPREDGQVIVKAIDPNTYGVGPAEADDTMKTQPRNK